MVKEISPEPEDDDEFLPDEEIEDDPLPELVAEDNAEELNEEVEEDGSSEFSEKEISPETSIRLTDFERNIVHIAGRDMYVYNFKEQGIKLSPLTYDDAEKISHVFVKPNDYLEAVKILQETRFLILSGRPHSGKFAMAISLAVEISRDQFDVSLDIYDLEDVIDTPVQIFRFTEIASLVDFLEDSNCPNKRIFIIRDPFVNSHLSLSELEMYNSYIQNLLKKVNCFVILTTDGEHLKKSEISDEQHIELEAFDDLALSDVLNNHLTYHSIDIDSKELTKPLREKIVSTLSNAYSIDRFVRNLSRENILSKDILESVLTKTTNVGLDAKNWFNELDPNERYYALLIGLCPELEKEKLWDLYEKVIIALQAKKVKLAHALNYPEGDLMYKSHSRLSDVNSLEFDNLVYREFVLEQVKIVYAPQFKYLSSVFADLVIANKDERDVRIALAAALGEIGKASWKNYENIIQKWAQNPDVAIRSAVAHSLRQLASSTERRKEISSLLKKWSNSGNYRVRWTVAAICERLYAFTSEQILPLLQKLAGDDSNDVKNAVAHALVSIAKQDLDLILELVLQWATGENQNQKRTAVKTFWRLINESRRISLALGNDQLKAKLLPLIEESCIAGNMQLYNSLSLVKGWVLSENIELQRELETSLLSAYERATEDVKSGMYGFIKKEWHTSDEDELYRFAVVLLDRMQKEKTVHSEFYIDDSEDPHISRVIGGDSSIHEDDEEKSDGSKGDDGTSSSLKGTALGSLPK